MKKIIAILLAISLILPILSVYAAGKVIDIKYIEGSQGDYAFASFTTTATPGSTTTRFGTYGWNIRFGGYNFLYDIEYNPNLNIEYKIPLIDGSGLSRASIQSRIKSKNGESSAMYKAWMSLMQTGGTIEFNASIHRLDNGKITGPRANTLSQALALADWGPNTRREFEDDYYNRDAYINPQPVPSTGEPIADMAFSDTSSSTKNIYLGESFTLEDMSYTTAEGASIVGWNVKAGSYSASYITNPGEFFKTYTPIAIGTFKYTLNYVHDSNSTKSENPAKTLTVIVSQRPQPGQGKVIYEYYKDSVTPDNMLGTSEAGISNPYTVVLPDTYGEGLGFKSATYSGEAVSSGGTCVNATSITINNMQKDLIIQAIYKAGATGPSYDPPTAIIDAPDKVMAGEVFKADGKRSHSNNEGGSIVAYYWDAESGNITRDNGKDIRLWYPREGTYTIFLDVEDEMGNTEWTDHEVKVTPPIPTAVIKYTGKLKENRKIILDSSDSTSPTYYPIDTTKIVWQITPVSGGTATDIKYEGVLNGNVTKDILFKKAGTYKIKLSVTNTYGRSASTEITLVIQPDLPPIAKLVLPAPDGYIYQVYREPADTNFATIEAYNESSSPDEDVINKAIAFYCYDSDNDGNYQEETWYYSKDGTTWLPVGMTYAQMVSNFNIYSIATSNVPKWTLKSKEVGKYYFAIRVMETIPPEETIPAFITESDYKRADSFK